MQRSLREAFRHFVEATAWPRHHLWRKCPARWGTQARSSGGDCGIPLTCPDNTDWSVVQPNTAITIGARLQR